jgi:hypothetical protein
MTPHRRRLAISVFVVVPVLLTAIWLARPEPPPPGCAEPAPELRVAQERWLSGAGSSFGAGGLLVLATTMLAGAWARAAGGGPSRPRRRTLAVGAVLALYIVACAIWRDAFSVFGLVVGLVVLLTIVTLGVPLLAFLVVSWRRMARRPRCLRAPAALVASGWCSLVLGVGGAAMYVAAPVTAGLCMS